MSPDFFSRTTCTSPKCPLPITFFISKSRMLSRSDRTSATSNWSEFKQDKVCIKSKVLNWLCECTNNNANYYLHFLANSTAKEFFAMDGWEHSSCKTRRASSKASWDSKNNLKSFPTVRPCIIWFSRLILDTIVSPLVNKSIAEICNKISNYNKFAHNKSLTNSFSDRIALQTKSSKNEHSASYCEYNNLPIVNTKLLFIAY